MGRPKYTLASDELVASRLRRLEASKPYQLRGNTFAAGSDYLPIKSSAVSGGKIDFTSTDSMHYAGIISPNVIDGQFSFACASDSTCTIYWDGTNSSSVFKIRRADQTVTVVPGSSISLSGLTHDVKYQAYAFWVPFNACGLGFSAGQHGTPQIAIASTDSDTIAKQAEAEASRAGREPLGNISWTQPTSGGSSSATTTTTPPTRQTGTCVMVNTLIEPVHEISPWDWRTVHHPETDWTQIVTDNLMSLRCTNNHPLYDDDMEQRRADWFKSGKWIATQFGPQKIADTTEFYRDCTKMEVQMKSGHLFWANGFLSHNTKLDLQ